MPAHDVEKNPNPASIIELLESAESLSEGTRQNTHPLTDRQILIETDRSGAFPPGDQRLDDAAGHRDRLLGAHDQ